MTKKTRIRVARIAAGAVIAAGASLTVAGVAQAVDNEGGDSGLVETLEGNVKSPDDPCDIIVTPDCDPGNTDEGA
ncbi:hypothetical protein ACIP10_00195, partial [Streptomyces galbus]